MEKILNKLMRFSTLFYFCFKGAGQNVECAICVFREKYKCEENDSMPVRWFFLELI